MLNGVYTPELSASIGKCQQFFHWKTPAGAGSEIADSLTVEGNFRVPATQFADQVSHFRNAIPLINTKNCSLSIVLTATDQKPQKSLKRSYYPPSHCLNVKVMLSNMTFLMIFAVFDPLPLTL